MLTNSPHVSEQTGGSLSFPWFAIHSKPLQEKRASDNLSAWGIETFLPQIRNKNKVFQSLFTSYLFARFPRQILQDVQLTRGVLYVVSFGGEPAEVPHSVIEEIRIGMEGGYARPDSLREGDEVVITDGPFAELRGIFQREISGTERAVVLLRTLYRATVEISRSDLKRAV